MNPTNGLIMAKLTSCGWPIYWMLRKLGGIPSHLALHLLHGLLQLGHEGGLGSWMGLPDRIALQFEAGGPPWCCLKERLSRVAWGKVPSCVGRRNAEASWKGHQQWSDVGHRCLNLFEPAWRAEAVLEVTQGPGAQATKDCFFLDSALAAPGPSCVFDLLLGWLFRSPFTHCSQVAHSALWVTG